MQLHISRTAWIYIALCAAILIDMLFVPFAGVYPWFPSITLSIAPAAFLTFPKLHAGIYAGVLAVLMWLASGLNLGIAVFCVGVALLFVREGIPYLLQQETWHTAVAASLGVVIFGGCAALATTLLVPEQSLLFSSFVISILASAVISIPFTALAQKMFR